MRLPCAHLTRHSSPEQAGNAMSRQWRHGHHSGAGRVLPTLVFACNSCKGYHCGTPAQARRFTDQNAESC